MNPGVHGRQHLEQKIMVLIVHGIYSTEVAMAKLHDKNSGEKVQSPILWIVDVIYVQQIEIQVHQNLTKYNFPTLRPFF